MKQQQRRVFLKVIAVSPLLGCGSVDPGIPGSLGGAAGHAAGGNTGSAGNSALGAGGNSALGSGGNPTHSGGTGAGGSPVTTGGAPAVGGAPAAGGATASAGSNSNDPAGPIGNVSAYPLGSFLIAGNIYLMGHDAGGLYAMSMQCTHKFCAVELSGAELRCPCHFSRFDHLGNVLAGPATTPLPHYKVTVDASGTITVDRFTIVSMSARTPV